MTPLARSIADLTRDHAFVRSRVAASGRTTLLHIGEHDTVVLSRDDAAPDTTFTLSLGSSRTANAFFHHDPPKPAELESAIDAVEDEVMRARAVLPNGAALVTTDSALHELASIAGQPAMGGQVITLDAVEMLFQRLASASLGNPGALRGLPSGREAAAVLLILREFMHHLGCASITVVDAPDDRDPHGQA